MADLEDVTLYGKPLHSLRVADLKSALEQRGLPKSGQKNALIKRLKGALMLENLQKTSSPHLGLQPNSQFGEEMSQNSFIKQYLAKQQELLTQRLEREAREVAEADGSPADPEDDDHTESSDITSCHTEEQCSVGTAPQPAEEVMSGEACVLLPRSSASLVLQPHAAVGSLVPGPRAPEPWLPEGPPAPDTALHGVASLSVRIVAAPPPAAAAPRCSSPPLGSPARDDCDDDKDSDEEWGAGPEAGQRARCKQEPPRLWQPTLPPSFPLPDTPKQSPPEPERPQGAQPQPGGVCASPETTAPVSEAPAPPTREEGPPPCPEPAVTTETREEELSALRAGRGSRSPRELEEERGCSVSPGHAHTPAAPPSGPVPPPREAGLLSAAQRPDPGPLPPGGVTACVAMETEVGVAWAGPGAVPAVLPPSPPSEEGDAARARPSSSSSSSSSDSDSTSSRDKPLSAATSWRGRSGSHSPPRKRRARQEEEEGEVCRKKKPCPEGDEDEMKRHQNKEVAQAGSGSMMEVEACSERRGPAEGSVGTSEESPTSTACTAQPSLTTGSKLGPGCGLFTVGASDGAAPPVGAPGEVDLGVPGSRKRKQGSSTSVAAKQQHPSSSISTSTVSLKPPVPDAVPVADTDSLEAVVELHPEEGRLSGDEGDEEQGKAGGLQVQHTVKQIASAEKQENGKKEGLEDEHKEDKAGRRRGRQRSLKEERNDCTVVSMETQAPPTPEADTKKAPSCDTLVHHSSSRQKAGVSLTSADPVRSAHHRSKVTNIIHVCNLVRPFTVCQLKELLSQNGAVVEEGFWIDKIKSHCYATYSSVKEAVAARTALHGVKWPQTNPRVLRVDFCEQDELDKHRAQSDGAGEDNGGPGGAVLREGGAADEWDQWAQQAQRQRERERRERARGEREWDRDKVTDFSRPEDDRRSPPRPRERREQPRKESPPGKLLDDLFCKTKASPCIYWLPLTEQQVLQRKAERAERRKERERKRKELEQQEEDEKQEKHREGQGKEAGGVAGGGGASHTVPGEGERQKEREKVRENEVMDKENEMEKAREKEERGRKEREGERAKGTRREEKERGMGRETKEGESERVRGREEKEKERGKERERERGSRREEKERERERGSARDEKERERERGRAREEKEREKDGRGREEKEREKDGGRGREEKERDKDGRGREEKEREREKGSGREEKGRERGSGRDEKGRERERGSGRDERERERDQEKRRDGYRGRWAESKSGGRRSRSHSRPSSPRDRRR